MNSIAGIPFAFADDSQMGSSRDVFGPVRLTSIPLDFFAAMAPSEATDVASVIAKINEIKKLPVDPNNPPEFFAHVDIIGSRTLSSALVIVYPPQYSSLEPARYMLSQRLTYDELAQIFKPDHTGLIRNRVVHTDLLREPQMLRFLLSGKLENASAAPRTSDCGTSLTTSAPDQT